MKTTRELNSEIINLRERERIILDALNRIGRIQYVDEPVTVVQANIANRALVEYHELKDRCSEE